MYFLYATLCRTPENLKLSKNIKLNNKWALRGQDYEAGRIVAMIHVLYIILEHVSFNIMFCIKSDVITIGSFGDIDCIYMDK